MAGVPSQREELQASYAREDIIQHSILDLPDVRCPFVLYLPLFHLPLHDWHLTLPEQSCFPSVHDASSVAKDDDPMNYQAIPWHAVSQSMSVRSRTGEECFSALQERQRQRTLRNSHYNSYFSEIFDPELPFQDALATSPPSIPLARFQWSNRRISPMIQHFQLRHLVVSPFKHHVFLLARHGIIEHLNTITHEIENVASTSTWDVTCLCASSSYIAIGSAAGDLRLIDLHSGSELFCGRIGQNNTAITNYAAFNGCQQLISANNDGNIRWWDIKNGLQLTTSWSEDWPINHFAVSPTTGLLGLVGDCKDAHIVDTRSNSVAFTLRGHYDYGFATAWHPTDPHLFATGNQDRTTRIWDIRYNAAQLYCLRGKMGAVRSIGWHPQGKCFVFGEAADYVHVVSTDNYQREQIIEGFGEVAGWSFDPSGDALYVGLAELYYGALLCFDTSDPVMETELV